MPELVNRPALDPRAGLPSALLQDGPGTPTQVTSLVEESKAKAQGESTGCADTLETSGAESIFRRDGYGSRLAKKPVNETKGEDEGTDGHIEGKDFSK